jgi:hypothetical protein
MTDLRNGGALRRPFLALGLALALGACTPQPSGQSSGGAPSSGTPCAMEIGLVCPAGQVDGCLSGATKTHECVAAGGSQCIDIRAALVKCKDGETMTHAGCPEPDYMQRCAPGSAGPSPLGQGTPGPATPGPATPGPATPGPAGATPGAHGTVGIAVGEPPPATPGPAGGPCLDIRAALVRCKDGERPSHAGCPGADYMQRCAPIGATK